MKLPLRLIVIPLALAAVVTASASGITLIRVHSGDTLSAIAQRYHTTVERLIKLNDLPGNGNLIYAGQTLRVPNGHPSHHRARHHSHHHPSHTVIRWHTVVVGDTVDGLAARYHVSRKTIARRNHLPKSLVIMLGQRLAIPQHIASTPAHRTNASIERERRYLQHRNEPSREQIPGMIRRIAARWHLDPRLALAISWQESGFNMREISPVGAIGTMQVMPYTGAYLSTVVVHHKLDLYDATDNITAGVALLSVLTHEAKSERQAVAGYYQGLQSVRDHGMYPSTKQYVANVMALRGTF
ncbi:MAG TPA: LysM peptidoglycan-binding domain-containing protein [Mycobacteriales bacterium]|nr:LysM peptidoglycan-binding domain-containing protein [Mycobacteriales bacterium]HVX69321.1 LysM peptidoglycan-binding domain-containing protein [Mycobacteriales bacterium]